MILNQNEFNFFQLNSCTNVDKFLLNVVLDDRSFLLWLFSYFHSTNHLSLVGHTREAVVLDLQSFLFLLLLKVGTFSVFKVSWLERKSTGDPIWWLILGSVYVFWPLPVPCLVKIQYVDTLRSSDKSLELLVVRFSDAPFEFGHRPVGFSNSFSNVEILFAIALQPFLSLCFERQIFQSTTHANDERGSGTYRTHPRCHLLPTHYPDDDGRSHVALVRKQKNINSEYYSKKYRRTYHTEVHAAAHHCIHEQTKKA